MTFGLSPVGLGGKAGAHGDCFGEQRLGFGELLLLDEGAGKVVEEDGISGILGDEIAQQGLGFVVVAVKGVEVGEQLGDGGVGRAGGAGGAELLDERNRLIGLAFGAIDGGELGEQAGVAGDRFEGGGEE
jgi:hypothetical protein